MLQRWAEVLKHSHPSYKHNIIDPSSMNIGKLGRSGALMSDTCNGSRIMRRLIFEQVHEVAEALRKDDYYDIRVLDIYCWKHLINVRIGGMTKALSTLLGNTMRGN